MVRAVCGGPWLACRAAAVKRSGGVCDALTAPENRRSEAIREEANVSKIDLPWIMARLRLLLDEYEQTGLNEPDWHLLLRVTFRHREHGGGVTLVVGTEPAGEDDE